ncbi:MAG: NAD-dependent epimerase/dehydratase family protein [Actinomycetota bacterium]
MRRVVLVTGVSRLLGDQLARALAADERVRQVIGVDVVAPRDAQPGVEFVRADIRNPVIARVIGTARVDTVVHTSVIAAPLSAGGRSSMKEMNVIGTMQLLAACQKAASLRRFVLKSSTACYGASPRDPALFTEESEPRSQPSSGYAKDVVEIEGYVRGFARRRPDVAVTVLRLANLIGPRVHSAFTRYFALPVVPTVLGFDPRLQFLHEDDAVEVLRRAALGDHVGAYNVAGPGVLMLSQALRRAGRPAAPIPPPAAAWVARALRGAGVADFTTEQVRLLTYGRVVDLGRLREQLGWVPRWSTRAAFDDYVRHAGLPGPQGADRAVTAVGELLEGLARRVGAGPLAGLAGRRG